MGLFDSLKNSLEKSRRSLAEKLTSLIGGASSLDDEFYEDLEATLIMSDTGAGVASRLIASMRKIAPAKGIQTPAELLPVLEQEIAALMQGNDPIEIVPGKTHVILIVGVNGSGKTTSIGKLAHYYKSQGKTVLLAAADTFRAAAGEQLTLWAERTGVDIVCHTEGSDPAAAVSRCRNRPHRCACEPQGEPSHGRRSSSPPVSKAPRGAAAARGACRHFRFDEPI